VRYSDLAAHVDPHVNHVPSLMLTDATRDGVIKFCKKAKVLLREQRWDTFPDGARFVIDHPGLTFDQIKEFLWGKGLYADYDYVWPGTRQGIKAMRNLPEALMEYVVRESPDATTLDLSEFYSNDFCTAGNGGITIRYWVVPRRDSDEFPDALYENHKMGLVYGAVACLNRTYWKDPQTNFEAKMGMEAMKVQIDSDMGMSCGKLPPML